MVDATVFAGANTSSAPSFSVAVAESSVLSVALDAEPITLQQAKDHLRVFISDDDEYIAGLIVAARTAAEGRLNRTIVQRQRVARFAGWGARMRLLKPPILTVDSIGYIDETGGEMLLDGGRYYLAEPEDEGGMFEVGLRAGEPYPLLDRRAHPLIVRYTAGYPVGGVPADIVQWMLLAIGTMYNNRESVIVGTISGALGDEFAKWLLQPHMVYE